MKEHEINILGNTLEGMSADAEDNGEDYIQPRITLKDARVITKALNLYCSSMKEAVTEGETPLIQYNSPFAETVEGMLHPDYKERFKAEYQQTKIRYNKLHKMLIKADAGKLDFKPSCPIDILKAQKECMGRYLYSLEVRAEIEGIDL